LLNIKDKLIMKDRIVKNLITTVIGTLFLLAALAMWVTNRMNLIEGTHFTVMEMVATAILGWAFLMAKNSLLNGMFLGVFKKLGVIKEE